MPRPLFIICADSGSVDRYSNLVSVFKIIEAVQVLDHKEVQSAFSNVGPVEQSGPGDIPSPVFKMRVVAVWICDRSDLGSIYEYETKMLIPGRSEPHSIAAGEFAWRSTNHRFMSDVVAQFQDAHTGSILVVNSIRPKGSTQDWITQTYEIGLVLSESMLTESSKHQSTPQT